MIEIHRAWANGLPPPPFPDDNLEYLCSLPPVSHTQFPIFVDAPRHSSGPVGNTIQTLPIFIFSLLNTKLPHARLYPLFMFLQHHPQPKLLLLSYFKLRRLILSEVLTTDVTKFQAFCYCRNNASMSIKIKCLVMKGRRNWNEVLDIDSVGTFTMGHEELNYIKKGGPGRSSTSGGLILNISATLHYNASWYQIHVAVAKDAVDAVTRNLALEWGTDYDIRVNSIAQGNIGDTARMHNLGPEEISNKSREYMPLYKLGEKYDISMAAL
ncbi:Peroxisomal 2,4-dienoyl-CoA reductase [Capsicum annuum]|nr:Peroxisomal 2,4-dienoyl-CoA reductase [Capsicum annuum]